MFSEEFVRRFPDFVEAFETLKIELAQTRRPPEEIILDDYELRTRLRVSQRTTATWRETRQITFAKVGNKVFYKLSDVLAMIERNKIPCMAEIIKRGLIKHKE